MVEPITSDCFHMLEVDIRPIVDDGPPYYKVIVYDVEIDPNGKATRTVRDIFHSDTFKMAIGTLASWEIDGAYGGF